LAWQALLAIDGLNFIIFSQPIIWLSMTDVHDNITRSYNMSMIKGKNTKPEYLVRRFLHSNGFRFRINVNKLPGCPDIILPKYKTIIFVNGCFWHGHFGCKYFNIPQTRSEWWIKKISTTKERDIKNKMELENEGWKVFVIWECQLKKESVPTTFRDLVNELRKGKG
jgi:DNA mismatch endonuclease, patch repair protein